MGALLEQSVAKRAPGPGLFSLVRPALRARQGDFEEIVSIAQRYDDVAYIGLGPLRFFLVKSPELVQEVLVTKHKMFRKDRGIQTLRSFLGNGLLTSEGEFHLRQRRLIQPAFHKERVHQYGLDMVRCARELMDTWADGQRVDINVEMMKATLRVIGKSMFNAEVKEDAETVASALEVIFKYNEWYALPALAWVFERTPCEASRRCKQAMADLDRTIYRIIEEHRQEGAEQGSLLGLLLHAQHEDDGTTMSDVQMRDEALTLFLAGHETTAIALTWTWYLLSHHPEVEARLHQELDAVLGARDPGPEDYGRLDYTRRVFTEAMRLYPPAYGFGREASEDTQVGPYRVRKGDIVGLSPYLTQRDARLYPEPERYDPDRWLPENSEGRHKFAYFPFGGGTRKCIGEPFAWMEGVLMLATIARDWRVRVPLDHVPGFDPKVTLRPRRGMPAVLERR